MTDYFSGTQLMKRWNLRDFELLKIIGQGKLRPHDSHGRQIAHPYYRTQERKDELRRGIEYNENKYRSLTIENDEKAPKSTEAAEVFRDLTIGLSSGLKLWQFESELYDAESVSDKLWGWHECVLPQNKSKADKILKLISESLFHKEEVRKIDLELGLIEDSPQKAARSKAKSKKVRPAQRHKEACRKIAARLWTADSSITIAEIAINDEIFKACDEKLYAERTIRNWINDLCPNRKPGRRPKNQ